MSLAPPAREQRDGERTREPSTAPAVAEYQLLRLRGNSNNREFRTVTGGVLHVSGGAARDLVPFEGTKVGPRTYLVTMPNALSRGEYGFLPPGAILSSNLVSAGKINSFTIQD